MTHGIGWTGFVAESVCEATALIIGCSSAIGFACAYTCLILCEAVEWKGFRIAFVECGILYFVLFEGYAIYRHSIYNFNCVL